MKENVLDVLLYLFQNFIDGEIEIEPDRDYIEEQLMDAGFDEHEIDKAFIWLDDLATKQQEQGPLRPHSFRQFTEEEMDKVDLECRGFLLYLENMGVLTPETRELAIERVMALDSHEFDIERLKWVLLMVLFNQPEQHINYELIENMVFDEQVEHLH